ncbi:MAG: endonuclease [Methermicoccaceae archaeon]
MPIPAPMSLYSLYLRLLDMLGHQHWWPADTPFEVMVGAILTQQTRWESVERAVRCLKRKGLLSPEALAAASEDEIRECTRCTGFYNQKTRRLKMLATFVRETGEQRLYAMPKNELRRALLNIEGVGYETADSIVLYAAEKPSFVIDAYTRRMLSCMGIEGSYTELKRLFEMSLPEDVEVYKEFHALIVAFGKQFCARKRCGECPIPSWPKPKLKVEGEHP